VIASSGRARLAYEVTGAAGGRDVLLIHAGVTDRRSWTQVVRRVGAGHRCVAYDMRGFGETVYESEDGWSPDRDALAVLDAVGIERGVFVAGSMGGQAAIDLALAHPERVEGLALIGTAIRGAPYPELDRGPTAELNQLIQAAAEAGDLDEVNRLEAWMWLDGPDAPEGRVGGEARDLFREMNGRALRAPDPGRHAEVPPAWSRLGEIGAPTLILVGRLDAEDVRVVDEQAAELIPNARLVFLDDVAHLPQLEGDPATLDEIASFVDSLA
jgi:pimeloyl-ACP methyl ester carboxylesterase